MTKKIRVLICDDSKTVRDALFALLNADPSIAVVGQASDGIEAVQMAKALRPDVITMDVQMPKLTGLQAIAQIMGETPSRILVVCSVTEGREVDLSFRAMAAGAMELIAKPVGGPAGDLRDWGKRVAESVRLMAEIPVVTRHRRQAPIPMGTGGAGKVDCVGLVASTGGPPALALILAALPPDFPVPILIAQHIAPGFANGLVRWFSEVAPLRMVVADRGMAVQPGHVYLPPDSKDIEVDEEGLVVVTPSRGGHCPNGNRLFQSIAAAYGERAGGVILTGMGEDGAEGLLAIRRAGGVTVAQDEASCVVYGMPQAAVRMGAASRVLPLEAIPNALREMCERPLGALLPTAESAAPPAEDTTPRKTFH